MLRINVLFIKYLIDGTQIHIQLFCKPTIASALSAKLLFYHHTNVDFFACFSCPFHLVRNLFFIKFCENNLTRQKKKTWVFHLISCTRSWNYLIHQISKAHDKNRERYLLSLWRICMNFLGFVQPSYKQKRFNLSNKLQNNSNIYFLFLVKLLFFSFAKIQNSTFLNRMVAKKPPNFPYSPLIVLKNTIIFAHLKLQNLAATEMLSAEKSSLVILPPLCQALRLLSRCR